MSTGISVYAGPGGFDSRLFFTGLLAGVHAGGSGASGTDSDFTSAHSYFDFNNQAYEISFEGHYLNFTPGLAIRGYFTSATLSRKVDGEYQTIATMTVFLDPNAPSSGAPLDSSAWMTPNALLNSLTKYSDATISFYGGTGNDKLFGSDYGDYFNGEGGNDKLTGYGGADQFLFDGIGKKNADHITDFTVGEDTILIDRLDDPALFAGVTAKNLVKTFHDITRQAEEKDDRILYNHKTGALSYDADGKGGHAAVIFAHIDNHAALDWRDFDIF